MPHRILMLLALTAALVGCDMGPQSAVGFRLPDGDAAAGQTAFLELDCTACHTVAGVSLPPTTAPGPVSVELGGTVTRIQTYGNLVTSIINPSHKFSPRFPAEDIAVDGVSKMRIYNEVITVQQVVDIVAFLQPHYNVSIPEYRYRGYEY